MEKLKKRRRKNLKKNVLTRGEIKFQHTKLQGSSSKLRYVTYRYCRSVESGETRDGVPLIFTDSSLENVLLELEAANRIIKPNGASVSW